MGESSTMLHLTQPRAMTNHLLSADLLQEPSQPRQDSQHGKHGISWPLPWCSKDPCPPTPTNCRETFCMKVFLPFAISQVWTNDCYHQRFVSLFLLAPHFFFLRYWEKRSWTEILALKCSPNSAPQQATRLCACAQDTHFHRIRKMYNIPEQTIKTMKEYTALALCQWGNSPALKYKQGWKQKRNTFHLQPEFQHNTSKSERKKRLLKTQTHFQHSSAMQRLLMTAVLPCFQYHLGNKYFNAVWMHHRTGKPQRRAELELLQFLVSPVWSKRLLQVRKPSAQEVDNSPVPYESILLLS